MMGISSEELRQRLAAASGKDDSADAGAAGANTISIMGREIELPPGVEAAQIRAIMAKRQRGEELSGADRALMGRVMAAMGGGPGRPRAPTTDYRFGGEYWVFTDRGGSPEPVPVKTGITDLEYSEIVSGLQPSDQVYLLPSSDLFRRQTEIQSFFTSRFGGVPGIAGR